MFAKGQFKICDKKIMTCNFPYRPWYQPSTHISSPVSSSGLDMGVSGLYQGQYGKCHVIISCIKSYFNQIDTFQNIGTKLNKLKRNIWLKCILMLNKNFHSNVDVLGRFLQTFSNDIVQIDILRYLFETRHEEKIFTIWTKDNSLKELFSQFVSSKILSAI